MIPADINQFLKLSDWKKIEFKLTQSKFNSYPLQTPEQENDRKKAVLQICAWFAMQDFDKFMKTISYQQSLDGLWPNAMELFVTPKLLDIMPYYEFLEFGSCYCCEHYQGYNKINYRSVKKSNIISLFGICKLIKNEEHSSVLNRVSPNQVCVSWNPLKMYEDIMDYRIRETCIQKNMLYSYEDYIQDINIVNLWDYFQNRYKSEGIII